MKNCDCVKRFQEYLQIKTVHPHPDYAKAVQYLKQIGESIPLKCEVFTITSGNLLLIMTLEGTEPSLPSILLNSHMDVVPVYEEKWKYDPFSGHIDEKGDIYGRGSQDMKNVGMQYLEAILHLKRQGKTFKRTIHLSFVPDEEMGGKLGMAKFIETDSFKKLNVGVCLDEGIATEDDKFLLDKFLDIRESEKARMKWNPSLTMGDLMTVNLTELSKLIPAYGFSPIIKTPVLLHDNDERLNKDVYLEGIRIYEQLIEELANVP
ncbi:Aminoacylase-1, partial [Trichinella pseudospiralis]